MDAPLSGTSQGYGASDLPFIAVGSSSFNDPVLESLLECFLGGDYPNSQCSVNDLFNEPSTAHQNEASNAPSAPSECKLQPRVYSRFPSRILSYTPPPSATVTEHQCLPAKPQLPADVSTSAPIIMPSHPTAADVVVPVIMPCRPLPADVVPWGMLLHADVSSHFPHFRAPNMPPHPHVSMPPQHQPPPHPNFNTHQLDACLNVMGCTGSQSHDPHHNFRLSGVEAKEKNQIHHDPFEDTSKLTPMSMHQNSMKLELPRLEVPRSPIACVTSGTASPAYMQGSPFSTAADSDSAAMEMSSMSTPATPGTSNASFYWRSTPPQRTSFSVPPSPTPSVTKKESAIEKMRSSTHGKISKVAFRVKTNSLNLHDGYTWKKYGEKDIKKEKYTRSYYICNEKDRWECEVVKRTQRCSDDEDYIMFTYEGRHTHPPNYFKESSTPRKESSNH